eukprot:scaffold1533_cov157-Amphora_coffeaeformis.AAC.3
MVVGTQIQRIGATPSIENVDLYMKDLGLRATVVGQSVQGRDLIVYDNYPDPLDRRRRKKNATHSAGEDIPTVLFLSMVHGNEPMGLISLLSAAHILAEGSSRLRGGNAPAVRLLFFPLVNVDGYVQNLQCSQGWHRGNMRDTACPHPVSFGGCANGKKQDDSENSMVVGVDLNRNFPMDWNGTYNVASENSPTDNCASNYRGPEPFSEPETRAIRQLTADYNIVAALSFHSLSSIKRGKAMLIHPYTSERPLSQMPSDDLAKFRAWGHALNTNGLYKVGTAAETIDYTAGGTTIDWLYGAQNVTSFVLEVVPVCDARWCPATPRLYRSARDYGNVGRRFVELVVHGRVVQDGTSIRRSILFLLAVFVAWITWTWKMPLWSFARRRIYGKFKIVGDNDDNRDVELQSLRSSKSQH